MHTFFLGGEGSVRLQLNRANKISDKFFLKVNIASEDGNIKVITQPIKCMVIMYSLYRQPNYNLDWISIRKWIDTE